MADDKDIDLRKQAENQRAIRTLMSDIAEKFRAINKIAEEISEELSKQDITTRKIQSTIEELVKLYDIDLRNEQERMHFAIKINELLNKRLPGLSNQNKRMEEARKLAVAVGRSFTLSNEEIKEMQELMGRAELKTSKFASLVQRASSLWRPISERIREAEKGTAKIVDSQTGMVRRTRTFSDMLITGIANTIKEITRMLKSSLGLTMGFAYVLKELIDLWYRQYTIVGKVNLLLGEAYLTGDSLTGIGAKIYTAIEKTSASLRMTVSEVEDISKNLILSGIAMARLRDEGDIWLDRLKLSTALVKGVGISLNQWSNLVRRFIVGFNEVNRVMIKSTELGDLQVRSADVLATSIVNLSTQLMRRFNVPLDESLNIMTSIVEESDRLNINWRQGIAVYAGLLDMVRGHQRAAGDILMMSEEAVKQFANLSTQASSMTLSWKALVAYLGGREFSNIYDLESIFSNAEKSAMAIWDAVRGIARRGVLAGLGIPPELARAIATGKPLVAFRKEDVALAARSIYDALRRPFEEMGISIEVLTEALYKGDEGRKFLQQAMEKARKRQEQMVKLREDSMKAMINLSANVTKFQSGLAGWFNTLFAYLRLLVFGVSRLLDRFFLGRAGTMMRLGAFLPGVRQATLEKLTTLVRQKGLEEERVASIIRDLATKRGISIEEATRLFIQKQREEERRYMENLSRIGRLKILLPASVPRRLIEQLSAVIEKRGIDERRAVEEIRNIARTKHVSWREAIDIFIKNTASLGATMNQIKGELESHRRSQEISSKNETQYRKPATIELRER